MILGAISDTHDNAEAVDRAVKLFNERGVKFAVHGGDWCAPFTLLRFKALKAELKGVYGNVDGERQKLMEYGKSLGYELGEFVEFEAEDVKVSVIHGVDERLVKALAKCGEYTLVVRGHTHKQGLVNLGGCLVLNPGEACGYITGKRSAAVINLKTMYVEFIEL